MVHACGLLPCNLSPHPFTGCGWTRLSALEVVFYTPNFKKRLPVDYRWQSLPVGTLTRAPLPLYGIATCTPFSTLHHHRSTTHAAGRE